MLKNVRMVCSLDMCCGCMACVEKCVKSAVTVKDGLDSYNAIIDTEKCIDCGACERVCPNNRTVEKLMPIEWYQGWALDESVRRAASSGGAATAISTAFVENGGIVCSCMMKNGKFSFDFANDAGDVRKFIGSKYVKSDPSGIYTKIKEHLSSGRKLLFIGLPCQVAAVRNFVGDSDRLYTIDLICHGTPSPKLLEMFLNEKGYDSVSVRNIAFREKTNFGLFINDQRVEPVSVRDRYTFSFLECLDYTDNCYNCKFAEIRRISDITLGDSWGSKLNQDESKQGISLLLCQTEKGRSLLEMSRLHLEDVDLDNAIMNNRQLRYPSVRPKKREKFFFVVKNKGRFNRAVMKCYPKICVRQSVKAFLIKVGLLHR